MSRRSKSYQRIVRLLESAAGFGSFTALGTLSDCRWTGRCGRDHVGALTWSLVGRFVAARGDVWVEEEHIPFYERSLSSMGLRETIAKVVLDDDAIQKAERWAKAIAARMKAVWY